VHGEITQVVTANGALNPVRTVTVGSQISGIITELKVDFNSKVREGDVLVKIDPPPTNALLPAPWRTWPTRRPDWNCQFNQKRSKQLYATKLISESEFEQAEVALQQADANVKIRQASVDSAKVDLASTPPIAGPGHLAADAASRHVTRRVTWRQLRHRLARRCADGGMA